jgi:hypothetical protein
MDLPKVCSRLQQVDMNRRRKEGREKGRKGERKKERKISGGDAGSRNLEGSTGLFLPAVQQYKRTLGPSMTTYGTVHTTLVTTKFMAQLAAF